LTTSSYRRASCKGVQTLRFGPRTGDRPRQYASAGPASLFSPFVDKQGISKRFLDYFHSIDKTIGERTLGPDQTVSGKVQSSVEGAAQQARSIDEQKGISKIANDVKCPFSLLSTRTDLHSIMRRPLRLPLVRESRRSTRIPVNRSRTFTKRRDASPKRRRLPRSRRLFQPTSLSGCHNYFWTLVEYPM